ncbi:hypothetical protein JXM67_03265 [candidate division WOR-3 bacterium]|nr:hypothetical protein [candidate division WOR-3 bacterium]
MSYSLLVLRCLIGFLFAANPVSEVTTLYNQGDFEGTIEVAEEIIQNNPGLQISELIELRKYIVYSQVALDEKLKAKDEFKMILKLDSTFNFSEQLVSPKIIQVFNQARGEFFAHDSHSAVIDSSLLTSPLKLRTAVLHSMAFPGMGQIYSGKKTKGWTFVISEGISIAGLIASQIFFMKAREEYMNARDPSEVAEKYRVSNNWYKVRNAFGGLTIGIWVSAPLDVLLFPPKWGKER